MLSISILLRAGGEKIMKLSGMSFFASTLAYDLPQARAACCYCASHRPPSDTYFTPALLIPVFPRRELRRQYIRFLRSHRHTHHRRNLRHTLQPQADRDDLHKWHPPIFQLSA